MGVDTKLYSTDYMAAIPNHPILQYIVTKIVCGFLSSSHKREFPSKNGYFEFIMKYIFSNVTNNLEGPSNAHKVTLVNMTNAEDTYFMNATLPQQIDELSTSSMDSSVNWDVTHKDLISLQQVVAPGWFVAGAMERVPMLIHTHNSYEILLCAI